MTWVEVAAVVGMLTIGVLINAIFGVWLDIRKTRKERRYGIK